MYLHTRWFVFSFLALLAGVVNAQLTEFIDAKHIYGNTDLILVCQVPALEAHLNPQAQQKVEEVHQSLTEMVGADTKKLNEFIIQFGAKSYGNNSIGPTIGIVCRCHDEIPKESIEKFIAKWQLQPNEHNDHIYFMRGGSEPAFVFSENSLLIAEAERAIEYFQQLQSGEYESGIDILQHTLLGSEISGHINLEKTGITMLLKELLEESTRTRSQPTLKALFQHAENANLQISLDQSPTIQLSFQAQDPSDLPPLEMEVKKLLAGSLTYLQSLKSSMETSTASAQNDLFQSIIDVLASLKTSQTGDAVIVSANDEKLLRDLLNHFVIYLHSVLIPAP